MRLAPALAVLLLLASGCASSDPTPSTSGPSTGTVTDPTDYSYNGTAGSHVHDYWQGRSVVTVLDDESGEFSASCSGGCATMQMYQVRPDAGDIVPQGTAWVNVTVTWEEDAAESDFAGLELLVKTAQDAEVQPVGRLTGGAVFRLNTTNQEDDPPHYVLSLWRFGVAAVSNDGDQVAFAGTLRMRVEAVRGLPLEPYPAHPDRWGGLPELTVAEETHSVQLEYQEEDPQTGSTSTTCYGGCIGRIPPLDGAVVPVESGEVLVTVTVEAGGIPAGLGLRFHGADTWEMTPVAGASSTPPGTITFRIPVSGAMADSPYAPQSLWEFQLYLDQPGYRRAWSGTYTFTAVAVRA